MQDNGKSPPWLDRHLVLNAVSMLRYRSQYPAETAEISDALGGYLGGGWYFEERHGVGKLDAFADWLECWVQLIVLLTDSPRKKLDFVFEYSENDEQANFAPALRAVATFVQSIAEVDFDTASIGGGIDNALVLSLSLTIGPEKCDSQKQSRTPNESAESSFCTSMCCQLQRI